MSAPYDPKLRYAAEEFKALCRKYDCAGVVLFVSQTHAEYAYEIDPPWTVMKAEPPNGIRFRSKREDFPSKEAQHAATEASAHVITSIVEWTRVTNGVMRGILEKLSAHMKIDWKVWGAPDSYPGDGK